MIKDFLIEQNKTENNYVFSGYYIEKIFFGSVVKEKILLINNNVFNTFEEDYITNYARKEYIKLIKERKDRCV